VAAANRFTGFDVGIRATGGGKHSVDGNRLFDCKVTGISLSAEVAGFGTFGGVYTDNQIEICGNITSAPIHIQDNSGSNILANNRSVNTNGANYALIIEVGALGNIVRDNILDPGLLGVFSDVSGRNGVDIEVEFNPTLVSSGGGAPTYGPVYGRAQKIGTRVFFNLRVNITALGTLAAGNLTIGGLPFLSANDSADDLSPVSSTYSNLQGAITVTPLARISNNSTSVDLLKWGAGSIQSLTLADISATTVVNIAGNYRYR
jgi:hypothetical protein